jgi:hypothetical protein
VGKDYTDEHLRCIGLLVGPALPVANNLKHTFKGTSAFREAVGNVTLSIVWFPWVLEPHLYDDQNALLAAITDRVIGPAEAKEQTGG